MARGPDFDFVVVAAGDHETTLFLELDVGHELVVGQNRVNNSFLAQVPYLDRVVVTGRAHLEAVGQEAHGDALADVGSKLQNVLAAAQVPNQADSVQVAREKQATVALESHRVDGP